MHVWEQLCRYVWVVYERLSVDRACVCLPQIVCEILSFLNLIYMRLHA